MAKLDTKTVPGPWDEVDYNDLDKNRGFDWGSLADREQEALRALMDVSDLLPRGEVVGGVLSWGRGDGGAYYMVTKEKPLTLRWIPYGDRWQVEHALIRGLRLADVRFMLHGGL